MTTFERIKKLAKQHGMTLAKLNEQAELGTNSIYHWKTKKPSTDNLQKVAEKAGIGINSIYRWNSKPLVHRIICPELASISIINSCFLPIYKIKFFYYIYF